MANKNTKAFRRACLKSYHASKGSQNTFESTAPGRVQRVVIGKCARLSKFAKVAAKRSKGARSNDNATA